MSFPLELSNNINGNTLEAYYFGALIDSDGKDGKTEKLLTLHEEKREKVRRRKILESGMKKLKATIKLMHLHSKNLLLLPVFSCFPSLSLLNYTFSSEDRTIRTQPKPSRATFH